MPIAIHINTLPGQTDPSLRHFLHALFQEWTADAAGHQFLLIGQKKENSLSHLSSNNCSWQEAPAPGKSIAFQYWQRVRLPLLLKKNKTELLIAAGGMSMIPSRIPSVLLVYGNDLQRGKDKAFIRMLQQAVQIIVFTDKDAKQLSHEYLITPEKITVLKAAPAFTNYPLSFEEKSILKSRYTEGKEFFMYSGIIGAHQNLTNLLKAFSVFKKRQGTNTKLLLEGPINQKDKAFTDSLAHYKYREELVLTGELPPSERAALIAAAYALVDPAMRPHAAIPVMEAAAAGVPSICVAGHPVLEADTYLAADMTDYVDLASVLMQMYKDEGLRNQLIQKIGSRTVSPSMENALDSFVQIIKPLLR